MQQTSLLAYNQISKEGIVGKRRKLVMGALVNLECASDWEIADYLGFKDPNMVRPRRNELVKMGRVIPYTKSTCKVTGRVVVKWGVA